MVTTTYNQLATPRTARIYRQRAFFCYLIEKKHYPKLPLNDLPIHLPRSMGTKHSVVPYALFKSIIKSIRKTHFP